MSADRTTEIVAARLTDEQIDELVRLTDAFADEQPYALDELVGTVEAWMDAHRALSPAATDGDNR